MIDYLRKIAPLASCTRVFSDNIHLFFTKKEIQNFEKEKGLRSFAARYLIKKLLIDYFDNTLEYTNIEILNNELGKPFINIIEKKQSRKLSGEKNEISKIECTLSHSRKYIAVLVAIEK